MSDIFDNIQQPPQAVDHRCLGCGQHHADARTVALIDGATASTYSEAWRMECEARSILALATLTKRQLRLDNIEKKRGKVATDALRDCMTAIWTVRQAEKIRA